MKRQNMMVLARESADWYQRGLISAAQSQQLAQRYDRPSSIRSSLIAWLGLSAVFLLGLGVLAAIGLTGHDSMVPGVLLAIGAFFSGWVGSRMACDPAQRRPVSGSALVSIALAMSYGALALLWQGVHGYVTQAQWLGLLSLSGLLAMSVAYLQHLRWPLLLSLLALFHSLGAWQAYAGHGDYMLDIQDPRMMALVAAACLFLGLWHQQAEPEMLSRYQGFGRLYAATFFIIQLYTLFFTRVAEHVGWLLSLFLAGGSALALAWWLEQQRRQARAAA